MNGIYLLLIAIGVLFLAIEEAAGIVFNHIAMRKENDRLMDMLKFNRDNANRYFEDALRWKELAQRNIAKANGGAFDDFYNDLLNDYYMMEKPSAKSMAVKALLDKMDAFRNACKIDK